MQQELLLSVLDAVEAVRTTLALPTQANIHYPARREWNRQNGGEKSTLLRSELASIGGKQTVVRRAIACAPHTLHDSSLLRQQDSLVFTDYSDFVYVLLGAATPGTFVMPPTPYVVGEIPTSVAVGDFNGDGIKDLVVGNSFSATLTIWHGVGDGTFNNSESTLVGDLPCFVLAADFTHAPSNPIPEDVAVSIFFSNMVTILTGAPLAGTTEQEVTKPVASTIFRITPSLPTAPIRSSLNSRRSSSRRRASEFSTS